MKRILFALLVLAMLLTACYDIRGDSRSDAKWLVMVSGNEDGIYYYCQSYFYEDDGTLTLTFKNGTSVTVINPQNVTIEKMEGE